MEFDPLLLSRIQFALNLSVHIIFPAMTIGLGYFLFYFRLRYLQTKQQDWDNLYSFWVKIYALTFSMGVATGVIMSFQFGTNWPGYMEKAGNVISPLIGYEVLSAFFLEASFLGIMLYGKGRVSDKLHLTSIGIVLLGTTASAFWILSANSWMQTPTGFSYTDGIMHAENWYEIIFNPSFPYRLTHMLLACLITACFLVAGISAWRFKKDIDKLASAKAIKLAIIAVALLMPIQMFVGDAHGRNTLKYQPAKIAAIEAIWQTEKGVALTLFGWPNEETGKTDYAIKIPNLASIILTHEVDGELKGLNEYKDEHAPVAPVFFAFRIMVGMGILMLLISWWSSFSLWRNQQLSQTQLNVLSLMTFSGWLTLLAGWYTTEIGRQPWVVYNLIKTKDVVANHSSEAMVTSLSGYAIMYAFLLTSYILTLRYLSNKPASPLSAYHDQHLNNEKTVEDK